MRIRRFHAPDMRTALRLVREEQGEQAVILSSERYGDGIAVVAATDYDEALVQRALRGDAPVPPAPAPTAAPTPARISVRIDDEGDAPATSAIVAPRMDATTDASPDADLPSFARMLARPAPTPTPTSTPVARVRVATRIVAAPPRAPAAEDFIDALAARHAPATPATASAARRDAATNVAATGASHALPATSARRAVFPVAPGPSEVADTPLLAPLAAPRAPLTALHEAMSPLPDALLAQLLDPPSAVPASVATSTTSAAGIEHETVHDDFDIDEGGDMGCVAVSAGMHDDGVPRNASADEAVPAATATGDDVNAPVAAEAAPAQAVEVEAAPAIAAVAAPSPEVLALKREIAQMRALIEREIATFADERLRGNPVRGAILSELESYGCEAELARAVAAAVPAGIELGGARGRALALLAKSLLVPEREPIEDGGVIALVGPTGAGKTTTLAKLAARYAAAHSPRDVALVTLDGYRIGAREQLTEFGRRLGMPVFDAGSGEQLAEVLERLRDYPLVLVDTAGLGQRDRALTAQFNWISAARRVRSYLVLPANQRSEDLDEVVRRFRAASPEGAVLTKLDETGRLGGALSVLIRQRLPVAYATDGQRVPEDLQRAHAHRLVLRLGELRRAAAADLPAGDAHAAA